MEKKFKLKIEDKGTIKFIKYIEFDKSKIVYMTYTDKQDYAESWSNEFDKLIIPLVLKRLKAESKSAKVKKVVCYGKKK